MDSVKRSNRVASTIIKSHPTRLFFVGLKYSENIEDLKGGFENNSGQVKNRKSRVIID